MKLKKRMRKEWCKMKRNVTYSKEVIDKIMKSTEKWFEENKELSTELPNNNEPIGVSTSYVDNNNDMTLTLLNQPNRENRRKELKKKTGNPHELNVGRISLSGNNIVCLQKEKKKQFNAFIKGKVK